MPKLYAICKYCNQKFDRNAEPFVEVGGRRYAHKTCAEKVNQELSQEEKDYYELEKYIKKLFNEKTLNIKVKKQIKQFKEEYNFTYTGIQKTLYWWYEIKKHNLEDSLGGIGIVPFVYKDALQYYYSLYLVGIINEDKDTKNLPVREVEIAPPISVPKKKKFFNLEGE